MNLPHLLLIWPGIIVSHSRRDCLRQGQYLTSCMSLIEACTCTSDGDGCTALLQQLDSQRLEEITQQRDNKPRLDSMRASRRPTADKRKLIMLRMGWCHKRSQNPAPDEGEASSRSRDVEVRGRSYALARILSRSQMRVQYTRKYIAYTTETSPQARAHVTSTHC
jgi:hypothetical protein